jgi:transcriptional regulator with XRE-family HTH domain
MVSERPAIRFPAVLGGLLAESRNFLTQAHLAEAIGVTPSTVSQYLSGSALPRIDILARLATSLNVSADYLLFGEERMLPRTREENYFFVNLSRMMTQNANTAQDREWIRCIISQKIFDAVELMLNRIQSDVIDQKDFSGIVKDEEVRNIESCSTRVFIATLTLKYNVTWSNDRFVPGLFSDLVVQNALAGVEYFYFVPKEVTIRRAADAMLRIFFEMGGEKALKNVHVYELDDPSMIGMLLYEIDEEKYSLKSPIIFRLLKNYLSEKSFGFLAGASDSIHGDMIVDRDSVLRLRYKFNEMMRMGNKI